MAKKKFGRPGPELPAEYKLAAVQERMRGTSETDVAQAFGVSKAALAKWMRLFRDGGPSALESRRQTTGGKRVAPNAVKQEQVVALKQEQRNPGPGSVR